MDSGVAGLVGVGIGAAITSLKEWLTHRASRRRSLTYLASRLSPELARFVAQCAAASLDTGEEDERGEMAPSSPVPDFEPTVMEVDWKTLPPDLLHGILGLPYRLELARGAIAGVAEHDPPPDYTATFEERRHQYAGIGLAADKLARQLLALAKLPAFPVEDWDPVATMEKVQSRINKARKARARQDSKEWAGVMENLAGQAPGATTT